MKEWVARLIIVMQLPMFILASSRPVVLSVHLLQGPEVFGILIFPDG